MIGSGERVTIPTRMAEEDFSKNLKRRREISITVTGRRSGRAITIPVWFVADEHAIWLLPVNGSDTQWYKNLENNSAITIAAESARQEFRARLIKDAQAVDAVVSQFRDKYGADDLKRYYTKLDVAVQNPLHASDAKREK